MQATDLDVESSLDSEESSIETYLQRMSRDGTWGDGLMVSAASLLYNCQIHIHYVDKHTETVQHIALSEQAASRCEKQEMHLGFVDNNHYVSLRRMEEISQSDMPEDINTEPGESLEKVPKSAAVNDIGTYATPEITNIPKDVQLALLKEAWIPPENYKFPLSVEGKRTRKFNHHWLKQFSWLAYSKMMEGAYCRLCVVFANRHPACGTVGSLVVKPQKRYKDAVSDFYAHQNCGFHKEAADKAEAFLKVCSTGTTVVQLAHSTLASRMERNRKVLASVIESIIFCGRQNIALRGHRDDGEIACSNTGSIHEGNFRALLKFRMQSGDERLTTHLRETAKNSTMISKTTQEQIIRLCGKYITDVIVEEVKEAVYFSILADETTDASTKEQMALVLRYVKDSAVAERFAGFVEVRDTTGAALAEKIWKCVEDLGLDPMLIRGQGYDGASNMSGHIRGVAARIQSLNPLALYTHCCSHVLNLAIVKSCNVAEVRNMFGTIQKTAVFFSESAKRMAYLEEAIFETHEGCERARLKKHCSTRWVEQADALCVFVQLYDAVVLAFDRMKRDNDGHTASNATILCAAICQFGFLVSLLCAEFILNYTKPLSVLLQKCGLDMCAASLEVRIVQAALSEVRREVDSKFLTVYNSAVTLGKHAAVVPSMPRVCGRQTHRANPVGLPDMSPELYYRTSVFIPFLDSMMQELDARFSTLHQDIATASKLVPSVLLNRDRCSETELASLMQAFPDMPSLRSFSSEYDRWWSKWQIDRTEGAQVRGFTSALSSADQDLFPNIHTLLHVSATRPSSTATNERCFSALKRLKSYLRVTMLQERLTSLAMLHVHQDIAIPVDEIIDRFANLGPHRLAYL